MGYSEIDICNWSLTADPAHAILNDWSKNNSIEDLYQILQSIQRDDVMHIMQEIEINKGKFLMLILASFELRTEVILYIVGTES